MIRRLVPPVLGVFLGAGLVSAQFEGNFWEPKLPEPQAFIAQLRSIKSYRLTRYDLLHEGRRYPVTEFNLEMTHGVVRFLHIGEAEGKKIPLSLREIAEGQFGENHALERRLPSHPPPDELKTRAAEANRFPLFVLNSPEEAEKLYEQINYRFRVAFPW